MKKKTLGILAAVGAGILLLGCGLFCFASLMGGRGTVVSLPNGWTLSIGWGGLNFHSPGWDDTIGILGWMDSWDLELDLDLDDLYEEEHRHNGRGQSGGNSAAASSGGTALEEDLRKVEFYLDACDLVIEGGEGGSPMLEWSGLPAEALSYSVENGVLTVREEKNLPDWTLNSRDRQVALYLPDSVRPGVLVEMGVGSLSLEELEAGDVTLSAGVGDVEIRALSCGALSCAAGAGNTELRDIRSGSFAVACGVGDVKAENVSAEGRTVLTGGIGDTSFSGSASEGMEASGGVGNLTITLDGRQSDYSYDLSGGIGDIRLNGETISGRYRDARDGAPLIAVTGGAGDISLATAAQ